jgi:hypothetical protein
LELLPKKDPREKKLDIVGDVHFRKPRVKFRKNRKTELLVRNAKTYQNNRANPGCITFIKQAVHIPRTISGLMKMFLKYALR